MKLFKHLFVVTPVMLLAAHSPAFAATAYTTDLAQSTLNFTASQSGAPVECRFKSFRAEIVFSDDGLAHSRFDVTVDMKSVDTGDSERDETVRGPDFFAADKFPLARFVATAFTRTAPGKYEAAGKLTIRDVTRDIRLPFTFEVKSARESLLKGGTTVKRLDYGVGQGEWRSTSDVANDVKVQFSLRLVPAAQTAVPAPAADPTRKKIPSPPPRTTAK